MSSHISTGIIAGHGTVFAGCLDVNSTFTLWFRTGQRRHRSSNVKSNWREHGQGLTTRNGKHVASSDSVWLDKGCSLTYVGGR